MPTTFDPARKAPGVYVRVEPSGSRPIQGVGTSTAAFVGFTERAPNTDNPDDPSYVADWYPGKPVRVTSWTQYTQKFGGFFDGAYTPLSVFGFFANGGGECYIVRVNAGEAPHRTFSVRLPSRAGAETLEFSAKEAIEGITISVSAPPPAAEGEDDDARFNLTIRAPGKTEETYESLTLKKGDRNLSTVIARDSKLVTVVERTQRGAAVAEATPREGTYPLVGQQAGTMALVPQGFEGDSRERVGIAGLDAVDEITMIAVPDLMKAFEEKLIDMDGVAGIQNALLTHCAEHKDRLAILDAPPGLDAQAMEDWKAKHPAVFSEEGFGTLYYPWIKVMDPLTRAPKLMPPSGHVAGVWCRTDNLRGVHKAPANEQLMNVIDLERQLTQVEMGSLNSKSINCLRAFPGAGIRIWGGRTLAVEDSEWRYINVRRLVNYIAESIEVGTQWVVFEPNDDALWARVTRNVTAFLMTVWGRGALFGTVPEEAFFVKCDRETNPPNLRDMGVLTCEIGIAPVKPAEFVVFQIRQMTKE